MLNIYVYGANFSVQIENNVDETISAKKYWSLNSHEAEHTGVVTLTSAKSLHAERLNCS